MSEENKKDLEIISQIKSGWSTVGEKLYRLDIALQVSAQSLINKLIIPETESQINEAEKVLSEVKSEFNKLAKKRLDFTTVIDARIKEVAYHEKSGVPHFEKVTNAIINLKKAKQKREEEELEISRQKQKLVSDCLNQLNTAKANADLYINELSNKIYIKALGTGKSEEETLKVLGKYLNDFSAESFNLPKIDLSLYPKLSQEEINAEVSSMQTKFDRNFYYKEFCKKCREKFTNYGIELNHKAAVISDLAKKQEEEKKAIQEQQQAASIAAEISAAAIHQPVVMSSDVKPLKSVYKIEMEETVDNVTLLMAAFCANREKCLNKLKVSKWFSFTPAQIIVALEKIKNEDENFSPERIIFIKNDKL